MYPLIFYMLWKSKYHAIDLGFSVLVLRKITDALFVVINQLAIQAVHVSRNYFINAVSNTIEIISIITSIFTFRRGRK